MYEFIFSCKRYYLNSALKFMRKLEVKMNTGMFCLLKLNQKYCGCIKFMHTLNNESADER